MVVPIFFLFFVLFLKLFWEGVVPPSGFLVFFFPDVVAVVNVKLVFFFKLCDAVFDCGFNFCNPKLKDYKPSRFMLPTCHYDAAKADRAVTFIENLRHTKGKWAGKRFWLLPWQEQIIRDVFGIVDERGNRQFRTAYVEIGKKNGKSELAAAVALYDYEEDFSFVRSDYRSGAGCLLVPHHPHRIQFSCKGCPASHHPCGQCQRCVQQAGCGSGWSVRPGRSSSGGHRYTGGGLHEPLEHQRGVSYCHYRHTFNSDFLKSLGNGISKVGDTVNTVTGLVDKLGSMKNTIGNLGNTMQNLGNVLGTENGGGLLSNIGNFLSKIGSADGGQIVSKFGNLISGLTSKMGGLGEGISGIISKLGSLGSSGGGILSNLGGLLSGVVSKIGGLGGSLSGIVSSIGSSLGGIAGTVGTTLSGLLGSVGTTVSGLAAGAGTALAGVASSAGGFLASAGTALAGLAGPAGIAVAAVGGIGLGLTALWKNCDGFREGVTNIWNKVTSVFSNGVNAIKNGISNAASAIGNVASSIWGGIKNVASSAVSWGKDIVGGIAGGIKKGVSWVGNAVKSVAKGIRSFLHFSVPDEGPLSDADTYMPDFMKLLTGGIKKGEGGLISQIRSMAEKVQQGMEGISSFSLPELTLPHFDGSGWNFPQAALAGGGTTRTTNLGGVYITVNGYNARNDDELAQTVADKINGMIHEDDSVFK